MKVFAALSLTALLSTSATAADLKTRWPSEAGTWSNPYIYTDDNGKEHTAKARWPSNPGSFSNPLIVDLPDGSHTIKEIYPGSWHLDTGESIRMRD